MGAKMPQPAPEGAKPPAPPAPPPKIRSECVAQQRWAVHCLANLKGSEALYIRGELGFMFAASKDEATGKGMRWAERRWPRASGWFNHMIAVAEINETHSIMDIDSIQEEIIKDPK